MTSPGTPGGGAKVRTAGPVATALGAVYVGVDFTPSQLRLVMADEDGDVLSREDWPLPMLPTEEAWSWEVGGRIAALFAHEPHRRSALAIGVACPGTVDATAGRLRSCLELPEWDGLSVVAALRAHIDVPIAVISRAHAALGAETTVGAAAGEDHVLYVTLRGVPEAAVLVGGRIARGAHSEAGALPALPELPPDAPLDDETLELIAGALTDAVALLDPAVVVLDGTDAHLALVLPLFQAVLDEMTAGVQVARSALGELAALNGALRAASIVAFEGERGA
ncbi:MAG: ROK family protein [Chloroflexi bacterium]|nr:ROK family protein [Chloroflexota bacterium]MDA1002497.1 ROK family protein [Chloroflexota bacterium]